MITRKELQEEIKSVMRYKGITMQKLAEDLDISRQGVSFCLNDDNVKYDKLFELCSLVGIEVDISLTVNW